jgi:hypothetical protein
MERGSEDPRVVKMVVNARPGLSPPGFRPSKLCP